MVSQIIFHVIFKDEMSQSNTTQKELMDVLALNGNCMDKYVSSHMYVHMVPM